MLLSETIKNGNNNEDNDICSANTLDCNDVVNGLLSTFKGVQGDAFGLNHTKHGKIGRAVAKKLALMNSYDAARLSNKIMDILLLYDENNPNNPNNIKD